jgi:hypothetical protein
MFRRTRSAVFLFLPSALLASVGTAQVPREQMAVVRGSRPGYVVIDKTKPYWASYALYALALRANVLLLNCDHLNSTHVPGYRDTSGELVVPEGVTGIRQFAAAAGYDLVERAPDVFVSQLHEGSSCNEWPFIVFVEELTDLGPRLRSGVPRRQLEWKLLQTGGLGIGYSRYGIFTNGTYYWPSYEGSGREFYVLQESSEIDPRYPPLGMLRKVKATEGEGGLSIQDLWIQDDPDMGAYGEPTAKYIHGPIADLQLDFDGDGVVDVVTYSSLPGDTGGIWPLVILSGKTGDEIGELDGYEFVITRDASGLIHVRTQGEGGYREYAAGNGEIKLTQHSNRSLESMRPMLPGPGAAVQGVATAQGVVPVGEQLIDHFVLPLTPVHVWKEQFKDVRKLKELGKIVRATFGAKSLPSSAHVYADYKPEQKKDDARQPK